MNKLNKTICNIHFLVLNNTGNSDKNIFSNNIKLERQLSWIQKLYLEKSLEIYKTKIPLLKKGGGISWSSKLTKKKFFKLLPKYTDLTLEKKDCNYYMKEYSKVIFKLTGNKKLKKQIDKSHFGCQSHDSITWGVSTLDEPITFYPQSNINMVKKNINTRWEQYFSNPNEQSEFLKIDPKFHFLWRNKLIPAHEVIHNVNKIKSYDNLSICRSEWVASAANLNIYLGYLKDKYHKIKKKRLKQTIQLEAIASVLYIVELINSIYRIVSTIDYVHDIKIINNWVNIGKSRNIKHITSILKADEPLWRNTYAKHLAALVYAFKFFDDKKSDAFTKACINDNIWDSFNKHSKDNFPIDFWNKTYTNSVISNWITETSPADIKNIYRFITNPINGRPFLVSSKEGQIILKKYLTNLNY